MISTAPAFHSHFSAGLLCVFAVLALGGCQEREPAEQESKPLDFSLYSPRITVNGTSFETADLVHLRAGPDFKSTSGDGGTISTITNPTGLVTLTFKTGVVIQVAPDGTYTTTPAQSVPETK